MVVGAVCNWRSRLVLNNNYAGDKTSFHTLMFDGIDTFKELCYCHHK